MKRPRSPAATNGKHDDPLRAQARISGIEKSSYTRRPIQNLPSWFYRVHNISFSENRDLEGEDFDEDLSEMEEDEEIDDNAEQSENEKEDCTCGGEDPECDCQFEEDDDTDEDDESERSYNGSIADYYYDLKDQREERKLWKLQEQKNKQKRKEFEEAKVEEVYAIEKALDKAEKDRKTVPLDFSKKIFKLFCGAHVDHCYNDIYPTKYVEFYYLDPSGIYSADKPMVGGENDMLDGSIYLGPSTCCNFKSFLPPKYASREPFTVTGLGGNYELVFHFIDSDHLKVRVSRDLVFMPSSLDPKPVPPTAPEVFEFVGILKDVKEEEAEWQERRAKYRAPSPDDWNPRY